MESGVVILAGNPLSRASDRIEHELRRLIMTLELPPGAIVTEDYLTKRLDCSRTPLREALQRLAQEHLVVSVPRRGVSIAELSIIDFGELIETLDGVERFAVRLAAKRITDGELSDMKAILTRAEEAETAGDFATVADCDLEFHEQMSRATRNHYAIGIHTPLYRLASRFAYLGYRRAGTSGPSLADHRRILDVLEKRDPEESERRVIEHLMNAKERIRAVL